MPLKRHFRRINDHADYNTQCSMFVDAYRLVDDWEAVTCKGCQAALRIAAGDSHNGWKPPEESGIRQLEVLGAPPEVVHAAREAALAYDSLVEEMDAKIGEIMRLYLNHYPLGFAPWRDDFFINRGVSRNRA